MIHLFVKLGLLFLFPFLDCEIFLCSRCMPQCDTFTLSPIKSCRFLTHYINIAFINHQFTSFANGIEAMKPLIMQWHTLTQTECDHFLSLSISMESNATFCNIIIIISFCCQILCLFTKIYSQLLTNIFC